jgi:hypothetical protein
MCRLTGTFSNLKRPFELRDTIKGEALVELRDSIKGEFRWYC